MVVASAAAVLAAVANPRGEVSRPSLTWAVTDPQKRWHAKVAADQYPTVIWERRHGLDLRRSAGGDICDRPEPRYAAPASAGTGRSGPRCSWQRGRQSLA